MRCSAIRSLLLATAAVAALAALAGCSDDDGPPAVVGTATRTKTQAPTATPTPPPVAGEYSAAIALGEGETAEVEIDVESDGDASGTVVLPDPTEAGSASGGAGALVSIGVLGTVDTSTGAFDLGGTFNGITVRLTGVLPAPGRAGTVTLAVNGQSYTGVLGAVVPTATATSAVPVPTSTPTTGVAVPTFTATPASGTINGLSAAAFGTWAGEAKNESTNVTKAARLRVAAQGSSVTVTDLNGNIFSGPKTITMEVRTETAMSYNAFGPPVIVFTLSLPTPGQLVGLYGVTTTSFPPQTESLALVLSKEG